MVKSGSNLFEGKLLGCSSTSYKLIKIQKWWSLYSWNIEMISPGRSLGTLWFKGIWIFSASVLPFFYASYFCSESFLPFILPLGIVFLRLSVLPQTWSVCVHLKQKLLIWQSTINTSLISFLQLKVAYLIIIFSSPCLKGSLLVFCCDLLDFPSGISLVCLRIHLLLHAKLSVKSI